MMHVKAASKLLFEQIIKHVGMEPLEILSHLCFQSECPGTRIAAAIKAPWHKGNQWICVTLPFIKAKTKRGRGEKRTNV